MNNEAKIKQIIFMDTVVINFLKNSLNAVYKQSNYATRPLILKKCKMVSVFTSGYVNTETILHFFYKITNERGTKTVFHTLM